MNTERIYNFSAGPSMLPLPVLEKAAAELLNYNGSGMSVMEMSHRSKFFDEIIQSAESLLRRVMNIPANYRVLFLQGGASTQFAMVPLNLLSSPQARADYIVSGSFAKKAYEEAQKFSSNIHCAASSKAENFVRVPGQDELELSPDADYVHICFNNTIYGTKYPYIPDTGSVPLAADMSSCILSEPIDVSRFGLIYAGAQKNVAPAGVTIVVIRDDLIKEPLPGTPTMLSYKIQAENDSMYNTPPCYPIYICKLVLEWIESTGGLDALAERNRQKAALLYDYLDNSVLFTPVADKASRSIMNVTFRTNDPELDAEFAKQSAAAGLSNLKGHRSVGGMRASIYNAMPYAGVQALVDFMRKFEREHK